ncbi:MAG TPA: ABC transporter substrate-binding protein [Candidatus Limnocylindrales bacterium]|nr:ABC transporter substrate-binding protein [Candidatus Limnocylindrales bacterium]
MRKKLFALCFVLALSISPSHRSTCAAEKLDKLRFSYAPLSANGFLWFIAKDAGFFEKKRLDVDMYFEGASPIMVQSILAGENQLAGMGGPAVVTNVLQGGDVIQVALSRIPSPRRCMSSRRSPS